MEVLNEDFQQRRFPGETEDFQREYDPIKLRFSKEMAYRVYDEFDKTQVERQENGELIVSVNMPGWLDFCYRSEHRLTYFHLFL